MTDSAVFHDTSDDSFRDAAGAITEFPGGGGSGGYIGYIRVEDQKTANTNGGTFTSGSYQTRVLNTEVTDINNDCSLSSNQMTLSAGTYDCLITCPCWLVNENKARLYNVTDAVLLIQGTSEYSEVSAGHSVCHSTVRGRFTIAASKAIEVQHRCLTTRSTDGLGVPSNFGDTEVYTVVELWRVS